MTFNVCKGHWSYFHSVLGLVNLYSCNLHVMTSMFQKLWLTAVCGKVGIRASLWPWSKIRSISLRALGTLRTVYLVWRGILTDPTVTGVWGPHRRVWYRNTQESVEEVAVHLVGRLLHLSGRNTGDSFCWGVEWSRPKTCIVCQG